MSNAVHPTFAPFLASIAPPVICRRCDAQITPAIHTLQQCESNQADKARISAEYQRAARTLKAWHEANDRAAFKLQIKTQDTVGEV